MASLIVDANYRFIAASQEVNARVTQRQQALAMYVSILVGLLAAVVALRPGAGSATAAPVEWLVLAFPIASICFAFLNYKAERAITNLRTFMSELERLDDMHARLPSYNTDPRWSQGANHARRFHDYAVAVFVAGGNALGLGAARVIHPLRFAEMPAFIWVAGVLGLAAFVLVWLTPRWSYSPV